MFGSDKNANQSQKRGATAKDTGVTILTSGCHFTGKLFCRGATRIGGTIEGQVIAEGLLVIEDEAVVTGDIDAEDVVVHGRIEGKVEGRNRIEMCSTADVQAEVSTPSLVVHDGALFNGKTTMKRKPAQVATDGKNQNGKNIKLSGGRKDDADKVSGPDIRAARMQNDETLGLEPEPAL